MSRSNSRLLYLIKRNPMGVIALLVSLALVAAIYLRKDLIPEQREQLNQITATSDRLSLNLKYASQLKEQLQEITQLNKAIDARLARVSESAANSGYFYQLETATGVKMEHSSSGPKGSGALVPLGFNVNVQGRYEQVFNFLRRLENGQYFCRINSVSCSGSGATANDLVSMRINLELLGQP